MEVTFPKNYFDNFKDKKEVSWLARVGENWDLIVVILAKDITRVNNLCNDMVYKFNKEIATKEMSLATEVFHFKNKFLHEKPDISYSTVGESIENIKLDKKDISILNSLSKNARIKTTELANILKVSPKTIAARIKRLVKEKIILEFRTNINYKKIGYQHSHISFILSERSRKEEKTFFNILAVHPRVLYITKSIGHRDIEFEILTEDQYESHKIISDLKRLLKLPIRTIEIIPTYKIYDIKYSITD